MRVQFQSGARIYEVQIDRRGETFHALIDGAPFDFNLLDAQPGQLSVRFEGGPATVYWANDGAQTWLSLDGCTYRLETARPGAAARRGAESAPGNAGAVRSPMPAQVRAVQVEEGEQVEKGHTLLLLEAMKMEIRVRAPAAGRVARLLVAEGQAVEKDQLLAEMDGEEN
jgi:acetyl/propionyl-CoA carboxylase alpha subunit